MALSTTIGKNLTGGGAASMRRTTADDVQNRLSAERNAASQLMAEKNTARQTKQPNEEQIAEKANQYFEDNQRDIMEEAKLAQFSDFGNEESPPAGESIQGTIKRLAIEKAKQKIKEKAFRRLLLWVAGIIWSVLDFLFNPFNPAGIGIYVDAGIALIIFLVWLANYSSMTESITIQAAFPPLIPIVDYFE